MAGYDVPAHLSLSYDAPSPSRLWVKYDIEKRVLTYKEQLIPYYVEVGDPVVMGEESLGAELFNEDLTKVDVSDEDSLFEFSSKYGILTSPLYEGHQRLAWFRNRKLLEYSPASFLGLRRDSDWRYADLKGSLVHAAAYSRHPVSGESMDSYLHPGVLSELVRDKERNNKEVRGAVSALEVAQTARLVQTATATCTAFQGVAERGAAGNIENAYSYVCNKRFLPAQGVRYFLDGREYLASFDAEYETSQKLRDSYSEFRAMGNSDDYIRRLYASMQVDAFREAAVEAYTFLNRSHLVCRLPLTLPELLDSSLSALLKRYSRKNEADLLEAVGEYGSLTEAVVQQYLSLLAAPSPWQQCENCGRLFKRPKGAKPGKKLRTTRFCSRSCNVSFNQKKTAE